MPSVSSGSRRRRRCRRCRRSAGAGLRHRADRLRTPYRLVRRRSDTSEPTSRIGIRRPRIDAREKVLGATRYAGDFSVRGMLHARIVPSVYAHSLIRRIDVTDALAAPGVVAVLTAADLPLAGQGEERMYEPLAREEVVFAGQPVALVVAVTEEAAEDAAGLVVVEEEALEAVVDVLGAAEPGAPLARTTPPLPNVFFDQRWERGDVATGFARCDAIVSGSFRAGWAYQAYLEPHAALAEIEPDGTLAVTASLQGTFDSRDALADLFGLPSSKVRVRAPAIGGGFGSKQVVIEPLVAAAALRLRRPVRLVLHRREDIAATNPAQALVVDLRLGARRDGSSVRFEALEARATYDAGSYPEAGWEWFAAELLNGPYRWPAFDVVSRGVRTNRFPVGNYRAPSGPQGVFALESLVDELAERLAVDPIDLRLANVVSEGDLTARDVPWPRIGAAECLERLRGHRIWTGRAGLPRGEGVGLAIGVWPGSAQPAAAACRLEPDGTLTVVTSVVDLSGVTSGFAALAAEAFGLPVESVTVVTGDTSSAPRTPSTNASAITYGVGPAVIAAANEARERLLRVAADELEIGHHDLEVVDGFVRPRGSPAEGRPVADIAREYYSAWGAAHPPIEGHGATAHSVRAPSVAGHLAHVRVDEETGVVELVDYAVVQDVGRAIDPALVEGQMLGAAVQSIGRALTEELVHDEQGQLVTGTFLDYAIPRAEGLPPIDPLMVEVPAPEGPFGAKGIGEAAIVPGPAAIANAVAAATDVRMRELPMTPRRVWEALRSRG